MPAVALPLALPMVVPPTAFLDHFEVLNVLLRNSSGKTTFRPRSFGYEQLVMVSDPLRTGPEKRLLDQGRFWYR